MGLGIRVSIQQERQLEVCTTHSCLPWSFMDVGQMRLQCNCDRALYQRQVIRFDLVQASGFDLSVPFQLVKSFVNASPVRTGQMANFTISICLIFHYPLNFLI